MKLNRLLQIIFGFVLLFSISCTSDYEEIIPQITYENGYFITNEGAFNKQNAEVSFLTKDLNVLQNDVFKANNNEDLGDVLQSMGFNGNNAYLVLNNSNKIEVMDRVTFKKKGTVTSNIDNPRYIAFSGSQYFVTNNNFFDVIKLTSYNISDNSYVSSVSFPRTAEKVVEAGGKLVVQTDGVTYGPAPDYSELPTGHTVTLVTPSNMSKQEITLPANGIIRDLVSYNGNAYVLASGNTASYIYKINSTDGTFTTTTLSTIPQVQKLRIDSNRFYFSDNSNKIYSMDINSTTAPVAPIVTATGYLYGFNVIDGRIFVSDASFTGSSKVNVYSSNGGILLKTMSTGIGTNGFYSN